METSPDSGSAPASQRVRESGHARNVASFAQLLAFIRRYEEKYIPSRDALSLKALDSMNTQAMDLLTKCKQLETTFDNAVDARRVLFATLRPLSTKVLSAFKASGVDQANVEGAVTISRKLQGRPAPFKKGDAIAEGNDAARSVSSSQQSYVQLVQHFSGLRALVSSHKAYSPNEAELLPEFLYRFQGELVAATTNVDTALSLWSGTRIERDRLLYDPANGLVNIAFAVKEYVKSVFGASGREYKEIKAIPFKMMTK